MIECKNISLSYSKKLIIDDFNLYVKQGENICIAGESGRGKSTLLKILQGYLLPDKGAVYINDSKINDSSIHIIRKKISWIPQNINLPVENGVELMNLMNTPSTVERAKGFLLELGLGKEFIEANFNEISGGQKQRVIIAICLSLNKEIVLMDEPTSSLDEESIVLLVNTIKNLKGKTIISASHNQNWINNVDKTIYL